MKITATSRWHDTFKGGHVGILHMEHIVNGDPDENLAPRKRQIESLLKTAYNGFSRQDLLAIPPLSAYKTYYRFFKKTYHLQLQIESIVMKNRRIPATNPLVDANFMAELTTFVLSAGHDTARLGDRLLIDASQGNESLTQLNGSRRQLKPGDMVMRDGDKPVCAIIYGQDRHSAIREQTSGALFVAYAPAGVGRPRVDTHLAVIREFIQLFSSGARTVMSKILSA